MKTTASQKAKIGIFTIIGVGLLLAGIFIIGNRRNMFSDTFLIYGKYKNVGGLQIGNNVRFAGINVGTVEGITIENDTVVRVDMRLQSKVKPFLKKDASASIGSDGLMGDKLVVISPGGGDNILLGNDGQITTIEPTGFDNIVRRLSGITDNAEVITSSLASISSEISNGKGSLGKLIYTDTMERGLVSTINSAHKTMQSAQKGAEGFSENMTALKHNFLLRGYYKHKAKREKEQASKDINNEPHSDSSAHK